MPKFCHVHLACADQAEAQKIANVLLNKHLIACVKYLPVRSSYWWKGVLQDGQEILLIMESAEELFAKIEQEVATLHSYETFVLQAVPTSRLSAKAATWLEQALNL